MATTKEKKPTKTISEVREISVPQTARWVRIGPELAFAILEKNTMNRNIRQRRVQQYANDMSAGNWRQNGDTIKFAKDGDLMDGQHRLWGVIESKTTQDFLVVEGLDKDIMPTIDTGAVRSFGDVARISGHNNTLALAAMIRWMAWYEAPVESRDKHQRTWVVSSTDLMDYLSKHPETDDRLREVYAKQKALKVAPVGPLAFVYAMAHRENAAKAGEFLALLDSGAGLHAHHPIYVLRERLLNMRRPGRRRSGDATEVAALLIKAWNHFVAGNSISILRYNVDEAFPTFGTPKAPRSRKGK